MDDQEMKKSKKSIYMKERVEIVQKLNDILGLNDDNNVFFPVDFDQDEDKQKEILDLIDDIRKYFDCWKWPCMRNVVDRRYLGVAKSVYKSMGYTFTRTRKYVKQYDKQMYCYVIGKRIQ